MTLQEKYIKQVAPKLAKEFGYKNLMAAPKIIKVVINTGVGRFRDEKQLEEVRRYLSLITGQKPAVRVAKKAIAQFKTREGLIVGYQVTLRGKRMYDFLSRLVNVALPRMRDFRGLEEKSFDDSGNLTIGIKEHIIFPEMIGEDYKFLFGFEITVATSTTRRNECIELLRLIGFPVKKD